jgi:hypothetical protein
MPALRRLADGDYQLNPGHRIEKAGAPKGGAVFWWRQIVILRIVSRNAERHRDNSNARFIVESGFIKPHPRSQSVARRIGEGLSFVVGAQAGRLSGNAKPGRRGGTQQRIGTVLRVRFCETLLAMPTRPN